ncbi:hypothetical protein J41TS12_06770 [Paenibacillus antibioticophila]|uniref:Uncharacterized protein n=1 Tax=Paenibacillus antibioticophila TaxID=1274374 RepID=A0A920CDG2_9BACL|nr:hypothetical protein [Paenibacillus antibioticophila]GIO35816.1 hypothetical protein J41TS12_06770 [Paenibacillus antibioticophila]
MKGILYFTYVISNLVSGALAFFLLFNVLVALENSGGGPIALIPAPLDRTLPFLIILILGITLLTIRTFKRTQNKRLLKAGLVALTSSFVLSLIFSIYSADIMRDLKSLMTLSYQNPPSYQSQELVRGGLRQIIEDNELPYVIDFQDSEDQTLDEVVRHVVILVKEVENSNIAISEVETVLESVSVLPKEEMKLLFFNLDKEERVTVMISKDRDISCSPSDYCFRYSNVLR